MVDAGIEPWLFSVEPLPGESLSHFLGRVRQRNRLTPHALGKLAGIGAVIARWERFHLNPYPTPEAFDKLARLLGLLPEQLWAMLPSPGEAMQWEPIRLCGACYRENPCHQIEWQYQAVWKCDRHHLKLLSKCPNCGARFKSPALWGDDGCCSRCRLSFSEMAQRQQLSH